MSLSTICPKCDSSYSKSNPPKTLINCSHVLCHNCLLSEILCPIDHKRIQRRKYTIQKFLTHQSTLALCSNQPQKAQVPDIIIKVNNCSLVSPEKPAKREKSQQKIQMKEVCHNHFQPQNLQGQLPPQIQDLCKKKTSENMDYDNCLLHSKSAELVCMDDRCFICPSCALFGQHKHHKVLSFQNFILSFGNLAQQCLNIKKQLAERQEKLKVQKLREEMQKELKQKQNLQIQNVKNYVNGIIKTIRQEEAKVIKHLQELFREKQNKIMELIHENSIYDKIREYESTVETLSDGLAHLLKMENIQHYVDFVDQNNSKNYSAKEGQYLLMQVDTNYKTLKKHITEEIAQIKVELSENKIQVIKNYITISSKELQSVCNDNKKGKKSPQLKKKEKVQEITKINEVCQSKTPFIIKNNDQEMLINSVERSKQININNNSLSPIAPIGGFEYVIESHFSSQIGGKTQRPNDFIEVSLIKLAGTNLNPRNTMGGTINKVTLLNPSKREQRRQNQSASLARSNTFSRNKSFNSSNQTQKEFLNILNDKNEVKKRKKIDLPQKYMKIYDQLQKDNLDVLDLGGAFLGDNLIFKISDIIPSRSKLRTVKFMNNKISDDIFPELLIRCTNVNTLNLSYNNLTERSLDFIEQEVDNLGHLANITLSNNKIILRNVKERLQILRKKGVKISL